MNKYEQLGIAGEGAYGVVLKCKNKETGKLVAIKKFKEPDEEDELAKKCTEREVTILKALKHENIVEMTEAFRRKGILYLVFEYMEKSMMDLLEANPNGVAGESVRRLSRQLTCALEHCHRHGVLHRDIKPENLLISPADESLRLCDFGSARRLGGGKAPLTDYVATRWYRAPELLLSSDNYSASVDVWGLACVAAELCDGKPLFAGETDLDQLSIIQRALGPLTPKQVARYMELSDFRDTQFPTAAQPDLLQKRFGQRAPAEMLHFLEGILKMDPAHRLSAAAALATKWFQGMQAAGAPQQPRQRKAARTPSPVDSVASEVESDMEEMEMEIERPASSRPGSRPSSSSLRPIISCSGTAPASARGLPSARSSRGSVGQLRPPSRSASTCGLQRLPPEGGSPQTPASQVVSPSSARRGSRPASRSAQLPRPASSSRRSLAMPRAVGSRPPSAEKPGPSPRRSVNVAPSVPSSPSSGPAGSPASRPVSPPSVDQSLSSPALSVASRGSGSRLPARPGSASASRSAQDSSASHTNASREPGSPADASGQSLVSYEGASGSMRGVHASSSSPGLSMGRGSGSRRPTPERSSASRPPSGRRPSRPPSGRPASGRQASGGGGQSAGPGGSGSSALEEAPIPDSSYSSDSSIVTASFHAESDTTATPMGEAAPVVGIGPGEGSKRPKVEEVPAKKAEESEVSYSSIPEEGKGQSRHLRSTAGESIAEEIGSGGPGQPGEEPDRRPGSRPPSGRARPFPQPWGPAREEPAALGPAAAAGDRRPGSICAGAAGQQRPEGAAAKGAGPSAAAAVLPGAKLGLIQRKGTRWKVS